MSITSLIRALSFFLLLSTTALAQRADALGVDGIYRGTIGMQLSTQKGKEYKAPAKFVLLPDGTGGLLTAQHPDGVLTVVMRGKMKGNIFMAESKGRLDYGGYQQAMAWDITMDAKAGTAVLHGKVKNLPKWAKDDDMRYTFKKDKSKK